MCKSDSLKIIARMKSGFPSKFGIPRQSGIVNDLKSCVIFEDEYRCADAVRGLEQFSHIWLLWRFSEINSKSWSPTVRPPRLGGNKRAGVFATRSPFRPNSIGLSCVKLDKIEFLRGCGPVLHVSGADLMDGTPIYDIKPYLPYTDCRPDASGGFTEQTLSYKLHVDFPEDLLSAVPEHLRSALSGILSGDPRPAYQKDPERIYGFEFSGLKIKFSVNGSILTVKSVEQLK